MRPPDALDYFMCAGCLVGCGLVLLFVAWWTADHDLRWWGISALVAGIIGGVVCVVWRPGGQR